ncbi:aminotransferase class I/II-fold pyridoxal phosphate-dependent enzyme [Nocardia brasiliensis]
MHSRRPRLPYDLLGSLSEPSGARYPRSGADLVRCRGLHEIGGELKRQVRISGGPLMFSGPVQPPMLGVAVAAARIHLSPELAERQAALHERIKFCTGLMREHGLPLAEATASPIRHVTLGEPAVAQQVAARLLDAGVYTNLAIFPAVPMRAAGIRMTLTLHHGPADIRELVAALDRHVPLECRTTDRDTGTRLCTTG